MHFLKYFKKMYIYSPCKSKHFICIYFMCDTCHMFSAKFYVQGEIKQTVPTQFRMLFEQSDQGLHCLRFNLHLSDIIAAEKQRQER